MMGANRSERHCLDCGEPCLYSNDVQYGDCEGQVMIVEGENEDHSLFIHVCEEHDKLLYD